MQTFLSRQLGFVKEWRVVQVGYSSSSKLLPSVLFLGWVANKFPFSQHCLFRGGEKVWDVYLIQPSLIVLASCSCYENLTTFGGKTQLAAMIGHCSQDTWIIRLDATSRRPCCSSQSKCSRTYPALNSSWIHNNTWLHIAGVFDLKGKKNKTKKAQLIPVMEVVLKPCCQTGNLPITIPTYNGCYVCLNFYKMTVQIS